VVATSLALIVSASPAVTTLWLQLDAPRTPCRIEALATAIHVQRPDAVLQIGKAPRASDPEAQLTEQAGTLTLTVRSQGKPLARELPPPGATCEEALQTAALMIDRYLDDLGPNDEEVHIADLGREQSLAFLLGLTVTQAPVGWSPGLGLELDLRLGLVLLSIGGEVNLPQEEAVLASRPWTYRVQPAASWFAGGVAPRLGPGRIVAQAALGVSLSFVSVHSATLFQLQSGSAADFFLGIRVGYALDLPAQFSLSLRYEERWVPAPSSFPVEGESGRAISIRRYSGDVGLLVGYAFF
jgi:hypothetical protein